MYCSRCGKEIDYDARFCVECAKELAYESALAASRAQEAKAAEDKVEEIAVPVEPASEPIPQSEPVSCEPAAMVVPCAHTHKTESAPSNATPGDMTFGLAKAIISAVLAEVACFFLLIASNVAITAPGSGLALLLLSICTADELTQSSAFSTISSLMDLTCVLHPRCFS